MKQRGKLRKKGEKRRQIEGKGGIKKKKKQGCLTKEGKRIKRNEIKVKNMKDMERGKI